MRTVLIMLALVSLLFVQGHASAAEFSCVSDTMKALNKKLGSKPLNEREFVEASLADQYSIFLYSTMCVHPPTSHSAELLARNGEKAIELLKAKILRPEHETIVPYLISTFNYMNRYKHYNVYADKDLMTFLENIVEKIENKYTRQHARIFMDAIIADGKKARQ